MNMRDSKFRWLAGLVILTSLVWGYWWLTWIFAIAFLFLFSSYYEIIMTGVIYDAIYGLPLPQFYNFPYVFTLLSAVLFLIAIFLKQKLLAYSDFSGNF